MLTDLASFKLHLGVSGSAEDARLQQLLDAAEAAVKRHCGRDFESAAATEFYDGHGGELLVLRRRPLTSVAGVWVDASGYAGAGADPFPESSEWIEGEHWFARTTEADEGNGALLVAISGEWPCGRGNIKATYTAGYGAESIPADLVLAVHLVAAAVRQSAKRGGPIASETIGRYSYTLLSGSMSGGGAAAEIVHARSLLAGFTEVP